MRWRDSFIKTNKSAPTFEAVNATLLTKASFIDQTMAGVYTFLPLGLRVLTNIENIIREEINTLGTELLLPALSPRQLWAKTNRMNIDILFEARGANERSRQQSDMAPILNPTHEEVITPIAARLKPSYRDLPFAVYQIQTKFRNEARPKSGLLRSREFRMKDLYSFHATLADLATYYEQVKSVYQRCFTRLGLGDQTVIARASGGDFTDDYSHEFQTRCATGEDIIYYDAANQIYYNKEVAPPAVMASGVSFRACEVGNIFPLNTKFSSAFNYTYTAADGSSQPVYMASYGIGSSRVMGVIVETSHDERGLIWPAVVAPYHVHLIGLNLDESSVNTFVESVYQGLSRAKLAVLFDDRPDISAGAKLADADLIGIPWRLVVSAKTGAKIERKRRTESTPTLVSLSDLVQQLKASHE